MYSYSNNSHRHEITAIFIYTNYLSGVKVNYHSDFYRQQIKIIAKALFFTHNATVRNYPSGAAYLLRKR